MLAKVGHTHNIKHTHEHNCRGLAPLSKPASVSYEIDYEFAKIGHSAVQVRDTSCIIKSFVCVVAVMFEQTAGKLTS